MMRLSVTSSLVLVSPLLSLSSCLAFGGKGSPLRKVKNELDIFGADKTGKSRRNLLGQILTTTVAGIFVPSPRRVLAQEELPSVVSSTTALSSLESDDSSPALTDVYFGVGCFWHIQHEFVDAERALLGRSDSELTSRTGYAGGTKTDSEGRVCYHNYQSIADYGKLGHGEAVGMKLPKDKIADFAKIYFDLFDSRTGERVDPQDRGGEYRSLLGLPGGTQNSEYTAVNQAAIDKGFRLEVGKGNDPDTLGKNKLVYVYDSLKFPFYQAEVYHQFHNDFQSAPYGKKYNELVELALDDGRVKGTGCPDRI